MTIVRLLLGYAFGKGALLAYLKRRTLYVDTRLASLAWGDGHHDDTRNLQRAMDTARRYGGRYPGEAPAQVKLDAGRFRVTSPIAIRGRIAGTGTSTYPDREP